MRWDVPEDAQEIRAVFTRNEEARERAWDGGLSLTDLGGLKPKRLATMFRFREHLSAHGGEPPFRFWMWIEWR